ncbi:hypothetical protein HK100_012170 [Physocladia obscura]|uniref:Uncharacterized protein n=1 Tax=Physocladia obscura TaxID=109957 RepID=A0AAD5T1W5_9FUNG|nr:hypothetical protein HK100_012170 [Physocladia obscura]
MTANDLLKGRLTIPQISDFWVGGQKSPTQSVIKASAFIGTCAELILIASSIMFSWVSVQTKLMTGSSIPPVYNGSTLPTEINLKDYLQGDVNFAEVYNYGLPLADGIVGGWSGWPMDNPMDSFQISGRGPIYVIQVLCDSGTMHPELKLGIATQTFMTIQSHDSHGMLLKLKIIFPPSTTFDDIQNVVQNSSVVQNCRILMTVGIGFIDFHFEADQWNMVTNGQIVGLNSLDNDFSASYPSSVNQHSIDAHTSFKMNKDEYGVLSLLQESILNVFGNSSFTPR